MTEYAKILNLVKDTRKGREHLQKVSPGEIGWGLTGAGVGGAAGYAGSKMLPGVSSRGRLIYSLLGALSGTAGSQLLLNSMPGEYGFKGTLADELRLAPLTKVPSSFSSEVKAETSGESKGPVPANSSDLWAAATGWPALVGAGVGAGTGAIRGFITPKYNFDISGEKAAARALEHVTTATHKTPQQSLEIWNRLTPRERRANLMPVPGNERGRRVLAKSNLELYTDAVTNSPKLRLAAPTGPRYFLAESLNQIANAGFEGAKSAALGWLLGGGFDYVKRKFGTETKTGVQPNNAELLQKWIDDNYNAPTKS